MQQSMKCGTSWAQQRATLSGQASRRVLLPAPGLMNRSVLGLAQAAPRALGSACSNIDGLLPSGNQPVPALAHLASAHKARDVQCAASGAAAASGGDLTYSQDFVKRRLLVFLGIVVGYSSYYLTRNSLTYTAPVMVADPTLGMDITQIGLTVGVMVLVMCRDKPEDLGFPPVEGVQEAPKAKADEKPKPDIWSALVNNVLKNPFIWGMALTYFFIYVVRQGVTSWFVFYLIKAKGVEDAAQAAVRVSGLELGGLVGSLIAGRMSDNMIRRDKSGNAGNVGKRVQVVMLYTVGIMLSLLAFQAVPGGLPWLQWLNVFMIGFFLYGPQMLIGLCGAELVGPESVGASEGFLGWIAYLGAANAGIPLSIIVKDYGWGAYFTTLIVACCLALLLLSPMTNLRSQVQRDAKRAAKKLQ